MQYDYLCCRSSLTLPLGGSQFSHPKFGPFVGNHFRMVLQGFSGGHRRGSVNHRKYTFGIHVPLCMY